MSEILEIFTIGHSNHPLEKFLDLIEQARIDVIVDVRSSPFSKMVPHFNRDALERELRTRSIKYVFVGEELGGRSKGSADYENGQVVYSRLAAKPEFKATLDQIVESAQNSQVSLMCSEKEPLDCHRTILLSQSLQKFGIRVRHLLADGSSESHGEALQRLLEIHHLASPTLFDDDETRIMEALTKQEKKIAYREDQEPAGWTDAR